MPPSKYPQAEPSWLTKDSVYQIAESVAKQLDFKPGSDMLPIIEKLGGKVHYVDFWDIEDTDSGSIFIHAENNFEINLSSDTSQARDRFTLAHELGHYVLHFLWPREKGSEIKSLMAKRYGSDRAEWEANWFAAAFLMPEKEFRKEFQNVKGTRSLSIGLIADRFDVSTSAARIRAEALGLIP